VNATDLITLPFEWGSALRNRKVFHPRGVVLSGTIERAAPPEEGLPVQSGPVVARFSKGVGTPGDLPDVAGTLAAWRASAIRHGVGDLFICAVANSQNVHAPEALAARGFDAVVEFEPNLRGLPVSRTMPPVSTMPTWAIRLMSRTRRNQVRLIPTGRVESARRIRGSLTLPA
jgi:hypothetical protein